MREKLSSGTPVEVVEPDKPTDVGLVVIPDIWGLRPLFDDLAVRFATEWGVAVAVVEPFPNSDLGESLDARFAAVPQLSDEAFLADLLQAADRLGKAKTVLMGFCMGGMYCFKATASDRFVRIASFYGMIVIPEAWRSPTQREPLQYMAGGNADRVLAVIGGKDIWTPAADVKHLVDLRVKVALYPEAEHGFAHDSSRPAHRPADAASAFARARDWLLAN